MCDIICHIIYLLQTPYINVLHYHTDPANHRCNICLIYCLYHLTPLHVNQKIEQKSSQCSRTRFSSNFRKVVFLMVANDFHLLCHRLLDSLVVECWHRVREVPGSIPSQGPRHTKDIIKMVPVVSLFSTEH